MSEAHYPCPYCRGKLKLLLTKGGQLLLLEDKEEED